VGCGKTLNARPAARLPPALLSAQHRAMRRFLSGLACCLVALPGACAAAEAAASAGPGLTRDAPIRVCEDEAEWPPFSYVQRIDGRKGPRVVGAVVDALDRILGRAGLRSTIEMLPWVRCLEGIKAGRYDMALNASYTPERARDFLMTRAVYALDSSYYYSRQSHPQGLNIRTLADLKRWRVCGLIGYNYTTYGLQPADMDLSPPNFALMLRKVAHGRCDLFIEKRDIIAGLGLIDPLVAHELASPDIVSEPVPGVADTPFFMIVSRATARGPALLRLLDDGIEQLQASGEMARIIAAYTAALGH
jgi:polar amino acid transport system substrate-binding protein